MTPETRYAGTEDGFHIASPVVAEGPVDFVSIPGWFSDVDLIWDEPDSAAFQRVPDRWRLYRVVR